MKCRSLRRTFLQAGRMLPAAELISSRSLEAAPQAPAGIAYRTLGKTGLKVSGVRYGLGNYPLADVIAHCIDRGINYFDTARHYGEGRTEKVFGAAIKGKRDKTCDSPLCRFCADSRSGLFSADSFGRADHKI